MFSHLSRRVIASVLFSIIASFSFAKAESTVYLEGPVERGEAPLPAGGGEFNVKVYLANFTDLQGFNIALEFGSAVSKQFKITTGGDFEGLKIKYNGSLYPVIEKFAASPDIVGLINKEEMQDPVAGKTTGFVKKNIADKMWIMTITYTYSADAEGPFTINAIARRTDFVDSAAAATTYKVIPGNVTIGQNTIQTNMVSSPQAGIETNSLTTVIMTETVVTTGNLMIESDVNRDGKVNTIDLIGVRNRVTSYSPFTEEDFRYDVNADGIINSVDLIVVRNDLNKTNPIPLHMVYGDTSYDILPDTQQDFYRIPITNSSKQEISFSIPTWHTGELKWSAKRLTGELGDALKWSFTASTATLSVSLPEGQDIPAYEDILVSATAFDGTERSATIRLDFMPLTATYTLHAGGADLVQDTAQTLDASGTVMVVDAEPDGETVVDLALGNSETWNKTVWQAKCTTCDPASADHCTSSISSIDDNHVQLHFTHTLDCENPQIHNVRVTVRTADGRQRGMLISFDETNCFFAVPEAQDEVIYAPVGATQSVSTVFKDGAPTIAAPTVESPVLVNGSLQSSEAGSYPVTYSYTTPEGQQRTYNVTFVAFDVKITKVRRDSTGDFLPPGEIYTKSNESLTFYAETYPSVPHVSWTWDCPESSDPNSREFGSASCSMTAVSPGIGKLDLSGYKDTWEIEVIASASINGASVEVPVDERPHVLVPAVAVQIAGSDWWDANFPQRLPISGHEEVINTDNLYLGAPRNDIEISAPVNALREDADIAWKWSVTDSAGNPLDSSLASLSPTDSEVTTLTLGDCNQNQLKISVAISIHGTDIGTYSFTFDVCSIASGDHFYVGEGSGQCFLHIPFSVSDAVVNSTGAGFTYENGELEYSNIAFDPDFPMNDYTITTSRSDDVIYNQYPAEKHIVVELLYLTRVRGDIITVNRLDETENGENITTTDDGVEQDNTKLEVALNKKLDCTVNYNCTIDDALFRANSDQSTTPLWKIGLGAQSGANTSDFVTDATFTVQADPQFDGYSSSPASISFDIGVVYKDKMYYENCYKGDYLVSYQYQNDVWVPKGMAATLMAPDGTSWHNSSIMATMNTKSAAKQKRVAPVASP